jgi:hypothetical protein
VATVSISSMTVFVFSMVAITVKRSEPTGSRPASARSAYRRRSEISPPRRLHPLDQQRPQSPSRQTPSLRLYEHDQTWFVSKTLSFRRLSSREQPQKSEMGMLQRASDPAYAAIQASDQACAGSLRHRWSMRTAYVHGSARRVSHVRFAAA